MKVRTKIALLLFLLVAIFTAGLAGIRTYDQKKFRKVVEQYERDRRNSFDAIFGKWTDAIGIIANDYSCWDALVSALASNNTAWAQENLDGGSLALTRANAIWVYTRDRRLFYSHNNLFSDSLKEVPLPNDEIGRLLDDQKFCHFFAQTPLGIFELRGATIHPSRDTARRTPHHGYLFVGHFWSREDLKDVSTLTGHSVEIVPAADATFRPGVGPFGQVTFSRPLLSWDGQTLATLVVRNDSPALQQLHLSSERQFLWLVLFAVVVFVILVLALRYWVDQPIRALSTCLRTRSPAPIRSLQDDPCEFGDFARLIMEFFRQRDSLIREMTERSAAERALQDSEERLRHSQKMEAIGRLAGGVAHDFNNLLTGIIGYAELILQMTRPGEPGHDEAAQITRAGEQAASLTRQLLAFSRKQILQPTVIDLNVLIPEMKKLLQRLIGEHIVLRVATAAADGRVCADAHQIEQVILNLGVNARDAMPAGGLLTIETANFDSTEPINEGTFSLSPGRYVAVSVTDSGCGMDAETCERIFEPFFTTKAPGKGTGLGLATVYGIVQQSGGAIAVQSTPGKGTKFVIYLPHEDAPVQAPAIPAISSAPSRKGETILIAEDDEIVRELVCAVLREKGYHVLPAASGDEALQLARAHDAEIHLVLTDIVMPGIHGPDLARELRLARPGIKVLFVSGYSDSDIADQGILNPDTQFLEKPFTPDLLAKKIREVLDEQPALSAV